MARAAETPSGFDRSPESSTCSHPWKHYATKRLGAEVTRQPQLEHLLKDWDAALIATLHGQPMESEPIAWKAKAVDNINAVTFWVFILALIGYALVNLL